MLNRTSEFISLDDLLFATYSEILNNGLENEGKRGKFKELINYSATLVNPLIRTSMSLYRKGIQSKFGEFAWYLSSKDDLDFIKNYITVYEKEEKEENRIFGAYGSRIFSSRDGLPSQYERIVNQLEQRNRTKQAYLVISEYSDFKVRNEKFASPPCTIGLHFYVRKSKLNLTCYMRSNDAFLGLTHDLFCFTLLQELISLRIKVPIGTYTHVSTSMHVYKEHYSLVEKYLDEGIQEPVEMPRIKICFPETLDLVAKEFDLNEKKSNFDNLDDYWKDFSLFSKKYFNENVNRGEWLNKFSNKEMKRIAQNSIS